jgi:hypothetical protein
MWWEKLGGAFRRISSIHEWKESWQHLSWTNDQASFADTFADTYHSHFGFDFCLL